MELFLKKKKTIEAIDSFVDEKKDVHSFYAYCWVLQVVKMGKVLRRKQTWMYSKPKDRGNINRCDRNVNTTAYEKKA
ncbi:hypothetical protein [Candidatus Endomicrobiellum agilis]|uniref:hypothetical protein n=1 Tax=Candidatus Endomicrobiellum agilis TaxID=3238957 RepID=UPI0035885F23|nr:hypothetical protein [Endomicrobium sp.]